MVRALVFSFSIFILTVTVSARSYAFEITNNSGKDATWENNFENAFVFSAAPSNTADIQFSNNAYLKAGTEQDEGIYNDWRPGRSSEGSLGVAETGFRHFGRDQYGVGGWEYTERSNPLLPLGYATHGMYVLAEHSFYNQDDRTVTGFVRAGRAAGNLAQSANGWSAGFVMKGFVPERPDGQFGFAISSGDDRANGRNLSSRDSFDKAGMETHLELTYLDKITDDITIQPGINFTLNPDRGGAAPDSNSDLTAGIRLHMKFK